MSNELDNLQSDIEEVCEAERPGDGMKTAVLVRAVGAVVEEAGDAGWGVMWAVRGKGYEEVLRELMMLEECVEAERKKVREVRGGRRRNRKRGGGGR